MKPRDVREATVTILIPALDEESTVASVVKQYVCHPAVKEVIVSDNLSSDRTADRARRAGAKVVTASPKGYGTAVCQGLHYVKSDWVLKIDADFRNAQGQWLDLLLTKAKQSESGFIKTYWKATEEDPDLVTNMVALPLLRRLYPDLAHIRSPLSGLYLFRRKIFDKKALISGFAFDIQLLVLASRMGIRVEQVGIESVYHGRRSLSHYFRMADELIDFFLDDLDQKHSSD